MKHDTRLLNKKRMQLISLAFVGSALQLGPSSAEPLDVFRDCDVCPEMVELPMGDFLMGTPDDAQNSASNPYNADLRGNEGPPLRVTVDLPIAMSKNEITIDQFMICVQEGGCPRAPDVKVIGAGNVETRSREQNDPQFKAIPFQKSIAENKNIYDWMEMGGRSPVLQVMYVDAHAYTTWLNKKLGTEAYRVPTEAEWEYAARAGTTTPFAQGTEPTADQVNINAAYTEVVTGTPQPHLRTIGYPVPVDEMDAANAWGLRHMSGNATELTMSCYRSEPERLPPLSTTSAWLNSDLGRSCPRVFRGGSFGLSMYDARVTTREVIWEEMAFLDTGFRIVKELEKEQ